MSEDGISRADHLRWAKDRALEYLQCGDLKNAAVSMLSDMNKHPETRVHPAIASLGMLHVINHDAAALRRWIEGFN